MLVVAPVCEFFTVTETPGIVIPFESETTPVTVCAFNEEMEPKKHKHEQHHTFDFPSVNIEW